MLANNKEPAGYASRAYAESLSEFGTLLHLPRCGGYLLKRPIPGTDEFDAMGCYPLFFCQDWSGLADDLAGLPGEIASVSLVADPFGEYSRELLEECFDVVNPFKEHYIVGLEDAVEEIGTNRHRKQARSALRKVQVEACLDPAGFADEWNALYGNLIARHAIRGIRAFSKEAFRKQLGMPGIVVHQALYEGRVVGAQLYYVQDDVVHCHLGAVTDAGYRLGAFYALDAFSFGFFAGQARWLDLGGGAGVSGSGDDGLSRYKTGWSRETRPIFFCGRIVNPARYAALVSSRNMQDSPYFPAYRTGEFS